MLHSTTCSGNNNLCASTTQTSDDRGSMDWDTVKALVKDCKTGSHHVAQWMVNTSRGSISDGTLAAKIEEAA